MENFTESLCQWVGSAVVVGVLAMSLFCLLVGVLFVIFAAAGLAGGGWQWLSQ